MHVSMEIFMPSLAKIASLILLWPYVSCNVITGPVLMGNLITGPAAC